MKGLLILILITRSKAFFIHHKSAYMEGDFIIGGLFPIHGRDTTGTEPVCAKNINNENGLQLLEAMIFTINEINQDNTILKGIKLGMWAYDYCDISRYALDQSLNFLEVCLLKNASNIDRDEYEKKHKTIAVIGAHSTVVTKSIVELLSLFSMPLISYTASSATLFDKHKYPNFFRTAPNDKNLGVAILKILEQLKWNYVSIIHSDSDFGTDGYQSLLNALGDSPNVCFNVPYIINQKFNKTDYRKLVDKLYDKNQPPVVVVFAERELVFTLLRVVRHKNRTLPFTWVFTDSSWYRKPTLNVVQTLGKIVEGALVVNPTSMKLHGFKEYFQTLLTNRFSAINPWIEELTNEAETCNKACSKQSGLGNSTFGEVRYLNYVRNAVYAVAYAIQGAIKEKCQTKWDVNCLKQKISSDDVLKHLRSINFIDAWGHKFRFIDGVDGPEHYSILNVQQMNYDSCGDDCYGYVDIGHYNGLKTGLQLNETKMKYRRKANGDWQEFPKSLCEFHPKCTTYQIIVQMNNSCCKKCMDCNESQIIVHNQCVTCDSDYRPNHNHSSCELIPEYSLDFFSPWSMTIIIIAVTGMFATMFVSCVYIIHRDTPIIKACGRESAFLSLLGIMFSFGMTFVIFSPPTAITCFFMRFGIGTCYTICYAALVTRIIRIHRIFYNQKNIQLPLRYTSSRSQLIIMGILILIEALIIIIWMVIIPPKTTLLISVSKENKLKICLGMSDTSYLIGFVYPFALIVISTIYAFKTRKCPDGFNEAVYIGFTNYTTLILWVAYVPLYLTTLDHTYRIIILAMSLSLNGLVELACLFLPRIYIIFLRPEKNTHKNVLTKTKAKSTREFFNSVYTNNSPVKSLGSIIPQ